MKENSIHVIPLKLIFSDKTYLDKIDITPHEFYEKLVTSSDHPKTSQPAVAEIKKVYDKVLPLYEKIVSIHLPGVLSGTLQNIEMTAKMIKENINKITCIDGKNLSAGLGLIVSEIVSLVKQKLPFDLILERTKDFIDNTHLAISLPSLKYLVKGGRVSKQKGIIGNLLHLNPIISINQKGELYLAGKAFGNRAAMKKTLQFIVKKAQQYKRVKFGVAHANAPAKAEWYIKQLQQTFTITDEIPILEAAPVLGVHAGPGPAGIAFIGFYD
jgi:DegV family protein with EDD domain